MLLDPSFSMVLLPHFVLSKCHVVLVGVLDAIHAIKDILHAYLMAVGACLLDEGVCNSCVKVKRLAVSFDFTSGSRGPARERTHRCMKVHQILKLDLLLLLQDQPLQFVLVHLFLGLLLQRFLIIFLLHSVLNLGRSLVIL
jgi:hypothetical protein